MSIVVLADKDIKTIHSPILQGAIAAMIRADQKAKAQKKAMNK